MNKRGFIKGLALAGLGSTIGLESMANWIQKR